MTDEPERVAIAGATALVYRDAPAWGDRRTAAIGGIAFDSVEAGRMLLDNLAVKLHAEGFGGLIGPMDGDTWHRYRVVTESDGSPAFALEPTSGPHDQPAFTAAGFSPISSYVSARAQLADTLAPEPVSMPGIVVTPWDGVGAEQLITQLFNMSASSFAGNHFFKPITLDGFLELYRPILPLLDPRQILFARTEAGQLVGFLFGMPDRLAPQRPAAILKTYASGVRGVGRLLADSYHRRALELGFTEVIHALMHEDNASRDRSEKHRAVVFRRYALLGHPL